MREQRLTREGLRLRESIAEAGIEITPDELANGLEEAHKRIRPGSDGTCTNCHRTHGRDGSPLNFHFGVCDECAFCSEPECLEFLDELDPDGRCARHTP